MKRTYITPVMLSIALHQQELLIGSNKVGGPSATFMSDPDIGDEDDASSRKMSLFEADEEK